MTPSLHGQECSRYPSTLDELVPGEMNVLMYSRWEKAPYQDGHIHRRHLPPGTLYNCILATVGDVVLSHNSVLVQGLRRGICRDQTSTWFMEFPLRNTVQFMLVYPFHILWGDRREMRTDVYLKEKKWHGTIFFCYSEASYIHTVYTFTFFKLN